MGVIFEKASQEVHSMVDKLLRDYHPELQMPRVSDHPDEPPAFITIRVMMASLPDDADAADRPLKKDGEPVALIVKAIPYVQRVDDRRDAEIHLDQSVWVGLTPRQQLALLDHGISALQFSLDKYNTVKTDDLGRPRVTIRPPDWHIRGYRSVAMRWGEDAIEVRNARQFRDDYGDVALDVESSLYR